MQLSQTFIKWTPSIKWTHGKGVRLIEVSLYLKQTNITPSSLEFEQNEQFATKLCTINEALAKDIYETVDLKVRVLSKEENKQPIV